MEPVLATSAAHPRPAWSHPLAGCDLATLLELGSTAGPVHGRARARWWALVAMAAGRAPLGWAERALEARLIRQRARPRPPVMIVGHWRSGTTHLGNLLARSPRFGFVTPVAAGLPNELLTLGRAFRSQLERSVPSDRMLDAVPVRASSPQEDEFAIANRQPVSFLHALSFPARFERWTRRGLFFDGCSQAQIATWQRRWLGYLRKLECYHRLDHRPGGRLLLRNPMFTARLDQLRRLVPGVQVIHLHRHPVQILRSMRHYYQTLLGALALQDADQVDVDAAIIDVYRRMMDRLLATSQGLRADEFLDLGYDVLDRDPLGTLETVYRRFGIPDFAADRPRFEAYLASISGYRKNRFEPDPADLALVRRHWQRYADHWGYDLTAR